METTKIDFNAKTFMDGLCFFHYIKGVIFIEFSTLLDKKKKNSDRCSKLTRPQLNFKNVSSAKGNSTLTA